MSLAEFFANVICGFEVTKSVVTECMSLVT